MFQPDANQWPMGFFHTVLPPHFTGGVSPQQEAGALLFSDMECARIRLICTLRYELEIDAETLPVILSLVDQLYDNRQRLLSLTAAIATQDKAVQAAILAALDLKARSGTEGEA
jgi:chaperone modulatory protein CbpM